MCDGGAELAIMSHRLYQQLEPRPELRPTTESVKGLYGPQHNPIGECTLQVTIPELKLTVTYDFIVDDIEEELLLDAPLLHYVGVQIDYKTGELKRKDKKVKGIARLSRSEYKARRLVLQCDWTIQPRSRQLVPGVAVGVGKGTPHNWVVETSRQVALKQGILVGRTLCQQKQAESVIPVEVYNPTDETVHLYSRTTLGIVTPVQEVTDTLLETTKPRGTVHVNRVKQNSRTTESLPDELESLVQETQQVLFPEQMEKFRQLLVDFRDVFSTKDEPLGQTAVVEHDIKTSGTPIKSRYRRIPTGLKEEAVREEQRMKDLNVIEPSESPWAAPVVLVRKRDGTLRYCIDYRKLNQVTQKDSYPLPNIQDCLDSLDGAKFFSTMDLSSGYWQVKMSEDAKDKTSFYGAGGGLWRFTVMPFGLCNAPATFERLMERILGQLQ